jgi:hypothetical protein
MSTWRIEGIDGVIVINADQCTTRVDGSLWLLAEVPMRPAKLPPKLVPVLILASGRWRTVSPVGAQVDWQPFNSDTPRAAPPPQPARLLTHADIPDTLGRRAVVDAKLAALREEE